MIKIYNVFTILLKLLKVIFTTHYQFLFHNYMNFVTAIVIFELKHLNIKQIFNLHILCKKKTTILAECLINHLPYNKIS